MCATNEPYDDRVKRDVALFLCEKSERFVAKQIIREESITVCGPCQDLRQKKLWKGMYKPLEA